MKLAKAVIQMQYYDRERERERERSHHDHDHHDEVEETVLGSKVLSRIDDFAKTKCCWWEREMRKCINTIHTICASLYFCFMLQMVTTCLNVLYKRNCLFGAGWMRFSGLKKFN